MSDPTIPLSRAQRVAVRAALASWLMLIVLCVAWEWQLAPLRPRGSWLILKAVPLLVLVSGVFRGDTYAMQWALLLVLAYFCEGVVRTFDSSPASTLAWIEVLLASVFFGAALVYLRPFKRAAKARAPAKGTA